MVYFYISYLYSKVWLILRAKDHKQIGSAHANSYDLRIKLGERLKKLNQEVKVK